MGDTAAVADQWPRFSADALDHGAFAILAKASQRENVELRTIAQRIVECS